MKKRKSVLTFMIVIALMIAVYPYSNGCKACASDMDDANTGNLDGMTVEQVKQDAELKSVLNDPMFYDYYEIDDDGVITTIDGGQEPEYEFTDETAASEGSREGMVSTMSGVTAIAGAKVPTKYKSMTRYNCVDVSYWQGNITEANWKKAKNAGITHAIFRVGYSSLSTFSMNSDSKFANNIKNAYNAGLKVGVYYYSTAKTAKEAKKEAKYTVKLIKNYKSMITLPVVYDYETGGRLTASVMKSKGNASCKAFCNYVKSAGYTPMIYANYTTLKSYLSYKSLQSSYRIWLAHYTTGGAATTYPGEYWMWQYSSSCKVSGLSGNIDISYIFAGAQSSVPGNSNTVTTHKGTTLSSLNYRTGPGTNYDSKGTYSKGTTVYMVSRSGDWAKMKNGYYVSLAYIKYKAKVTEAVNYRTGPGTSYKKKGTYSKGTVLTIVKVKNGWAKTSGGYWLCVKYTKMN